MLFEKGLKVAGASGNSVLCLILGVTNHLDWKKSKKLLTIRKYTVRNCATCPHPASNEKTKCTGKGELKKVSMLITFSNTVDYKSVS